MAKRLYFRGTVAERLEKRTNKNGPIVRPELGPCWLFTGCDNMGRGEIGVPRNGRFRMVLASRVAWEIANGPIPKGRHILHHCDTARCVRPSHLYCGNYYDNSEDMSSRGRRSGGKVVNREMVRVIRHLHEAGSSQYQLSVQFGLSDSTINDIVLRNTWRRVPDSTKAGIRRAAGLTEALLHVG